MDHKPMILAIDAATNSGFARGRAGEAPFLQTRRWRVSANDDPADLLGRALHYILEELTKWPVDAVAIEAPIKPNYGATNWASLRLLLGLNDVFAAATRARGIPLIYAEVKTWRKFFLGHGNMSTEDAKLAALEQCRRLKWLPEDHNSAEAAGIWLYACSQLAPKLAQRSEPLFLRGVA